jgi:hypothetical protein
MLVPQFSIRWLFALTAVCAVIFSVFGLAVRGSPWAVGVSVGIVSLVILATTYAAVFGLVWTFSVVPGWLGRRRSAAGRSPFRDDSGPASSSFDAGEQRRGS